MRLQVVDENSFEGQGEGYLPTIKLLTGPLVWQTTSFFPILAIARNHCLLAFLRRALLLGS